MNYRKLLAFILLCACLGAAHAASFADMKTWHDASLLNGRLHADVPKQAQLVAPDFNIMEAPQAPERALRVMIDAGDARLVMFAEELFRVAGDDFEALAKQHIKLVQEEYKFEPLTVAAKKSAPGGLELVEFTPQGKADIPDAHMIRGVLIRQADGTLQRILFFVNDPGMKDAAAANQLVTRFLASLKPGSRKLATGGRVKLAGSGLTVELPPSYTAYTQRGEDFSVDHIAHLVPLGQQGAHMGIYSGSHPEDSSAPADARTVPATLFGVKTEWRIWETPEPRLIHQGALARLNDNLGRVFDVFIAAGSEDERAAFQRIAETATQAARAR